MRDGGGEKTKIFAASAAGDGIGAAGEGRGAAAVLVVVMVLNKSKTICAPCFVVLFNVAANLFYTVGRFAPAEGLAGMLEADELEGCQADGLAGLYPPIDRMGRDDKSV